MFVTGRRVQGGEARRENLLELFQGASNEIQLRILSVVFCSEPPFVAGRGEVN